MYGVKCEGRPVRSKALASGANPAGVRGFKSHPSHKISFLVTSLEDMFEKMFREMRNSPDAVLK